MHLRESYVRRMTKTVHVGEVPIGGGSPIAVESMTKTDTRDVRATVRQIKSLEKVGCDMVRVAVPDYEAAEALAPIKQKTTIPIIADIHFNYKLALMALEASVDCVRINPGNIGGRENLIRTAEAARRQNVSLRIGVNAGSLEKPLLQKYGAPIPEALVESISRTVSLLEDIGFTELILSAKASRVPIAIETYRMVANRFRYPLHVGVTEAGPPPAGTIRSAVGIGTLLDFSSLFLQFHLISFTNELWILDPARDYLIRLFPHGFWFDAALFCVLVSMAGAVISGGVGVWYLVSRRESSTA